MNLINPSFRKGITDIQSLQTKIRTISQPIIRLLIVIFIIAISQTGKFRIRIFILAQNPTVAFCHFLQNISPAITTLEHKDGCTFDKERRLARSLEMSIEIQPFPFGREAKAIHQVRTGSSTNSYPVIRINYTITIDIFILNITGHHLTKGLLRTISDFFIVFEQP